LSLMKVPYVFVIGDKEREAGAVAVRARGNKDLGVMPLEQAISLLQGEIASKGL